MRTICGYVNDIAGVDGGYLVIGVKTENGLTILPLLGVPDELIDDIQLKIFQYCNKIEPRYIPKIEIVEYLSWQSKETRKRLEKCNNCLSRDYDSILSNVNECPICGSSDIENVYVTDK